MLQCFRQYTFSTDRSNETVYQSVLRMFKKKRNKSKPVTKYTGTYVLLLSLTALKIISVSCFKITNKILNTLLRLRSHEIEVKDNSHFGISFHLVKLSSEKLTTFKLNIDMVPRFVCFENNLQLWNVIWSNIYTIGCKNETK